MKKLLLAVLLSTNINASEGIVVAYRGTVIAVSGNESRDLRQGDEIFIEDEILTGQKSFATIQFYDGAKMTVRPESSVVINSYSEESVDISLISGGLRLISGAIAKAQPENFKLHTDVALMGIRGTELSVQYVE